MSYQFFGYAWSANCGWVNVGNSRLATTTTTIAIAITDTDGDGLSDAWERENTDGLRMLTATGDADGDGATDKEEYLAGTNPLDADSALRITGLAPAPTSTTVAWTSRPSRQYRIYESATLTNGSWSVSLPGNLLLGAFGPTTQTTVTNANTPAMFYRVAVLPTLAP